MSITITRPLRLMRNLCSGWLAVAKTTIVAHDLGPIVKAIHVMQDASFKPNRYVMRKVAIALVCIAKVSTTVIQEMKLAFNERKEHYAHHIMSKDDMTLVASAEGSLNGMMSLPLYMLSLLITDELVGFVEEGKAYLLLASFERLFSDMDYVVRNRPNPSTWYGSVFHEATFEAQGTAVRDYERLYVASYRASDTLSL